MPRPILRGTYRQTDPRYGRLETPDGRSFFVGSRGRDGAFDGDQVEAIIVARADDDSRSDEAKIVRINARSGNPVYGVFRPVKGRPYAFVECQTPENEKLFIPKEGIKGAQKGEMVAARVVGFGAKTHAEITERIGPEGDINTEREILVRESGLPRIFSDKVLQDAATLSEKNDHAPSRRDLSNETVITIDGADAKDLDDAISVRHVPNGFILGVHIADVAEYVREGTVLDREAFRRGTSCYLSDRVIPMLPEKLSNDLCSLHPGGKKLCLSIFMEIGSDGAVKNRHIEETAIQSARRCTYDEVQSWHDKDGRYGLPSPEILALVETAYELAGIVDKRRVKEGRIDFEIPELSIRLDAAGEPQEIHERERKASHRLIETFMVLANEEISKALSKIAPFIYRIHEPPSLENQAELRTLFAEHGIRLPEGDIKPKDLQEAYAKLRETPNLPPVERLLLSKLSKARYSEKALGHFGLALAYYSHFTSPIRRYPDLLAHRIIKESVRGKLDQARKTHFTGLLPEASKKCSETERRAEDLEYAVEGLDSARYMERHIGETFDGIVVGKSRFAYYVKLENGIEGAVYLGAKRGAAKSRGRPQTPREKDFPNFGTKLRVKLVSVERAYGRIDFEPVK